LNEALENIISAVLPGARFFQEPVDEEPLPDNQTARRH
jgi:hypothetical protein